MFLFVLFAPLIALVEAALRGVVLFWPVMILMGALHSYVPAVPALGWFPCLLLVALLGLLIPTSFDTD